MDEYIVLYTPQVRQKQKKWHDGTAKFHYFNNLFVLYDDSNHKLDSTFLARGRVLEGEELQIDNHLVSLEDLTKTTTRDISAIYSRQTQAQTQTAPVLHSTTIIPTPEPSVQLSNVSKRLKLSLATPIRTSTTTHSLGPTRLVLEQQPAPFKRVQLTQTHTERTQTPYTPVYRTATSTPTRVYNFEGTDLVESTPVRSPSTSPVASRDTRRSRDTYTCVSAAPNPVAPFRRPFQTVELQDVEPEPAIEEVIVRARPKGLGVPSARDQASVREILAETRQNFGNSAFQAQKSPSMDQEYPHIEEEVSASSGNVEFPENSTSGGNYDAFEDNFVGLDNYVKDEPLSPSVKAEPMSPVLASRDYNADIDILSQLCVVINDSDGDEGMDSFTVQKEVVSMVLSDEEDDEEDNEVQTLASNDTTVEEKSEEKTCPNSDGEISDGEISGEISEAEDFNAWKVDRIPDVVLAEIDIDALDNIGSQVGKSHVMDESDDDLSIGDLSDDDVVTSTTMKPRASYVTKENDTSHVTNREVDTSHVSASDVIGLSDSDEDMEEVVESHVTTEGHVTGDDHVTPVQATADHVMEGENEVSLISSDDEEVAEVAESHVSEVPTSHVTSPVSSYVTVSPQPKTASRTNSYLDKPFSVPFAKPGKMKEVTKSVATASKPMAKFTIRESGAWTNETLQLFAWRG